MKLTDFKWFTIVHINSQDKQSLMLCHIKTEAKFLLEEIENLGFVGKYIVLPGRIDRLLPEELTAKETTTWY